jgi:magnesium chelatase family protein
MRAVVRSAALVAGHARDLAVTAETGNGRPGVTWLGFPGAGKQDRQDRVLAAVAASGLRWPSRQDLTVTASPAGLPAQPGNDLAVAVAALAAALEIPVTAPDGIAFFAGLAPDGSLVPVCGVLASVTAAANLGSRTVVVAAANAAEARLHDGVTVIGAGHLADVTGWLRGGPLPRRTGGGGETAGLVRDMADVQCGAAARLAAEVAAAGGHHLALFGPPDPARDTLAARIPGIMPALSGAGLVEVAGLHSLAGTLTDRTLSGVPPFAVIDGDAVPGDITGRAGQVMRPGTVSLAHRGILFLREAPRLSLETREALRLPVEAGGDAVTHGGIRAWFPARFVMVAGVSPCPCTAGSGAPDSCTCSHLDRRAYLERVPGWLASTFTLRVKVTRDAGRTGQHGEPAAVIAGRVAAARERAAQRLDGTPWQLNSEIPPGELIRSFPPEPGAADPIGHAAAMRRINDHDIAGVLRVAWTLADLNGHPRPTSADCATALGLRAGDLR